MVKIYFSMWKENNKFHWKLSNYPHENCVAIDNTQQVYELCPVHEGNMVHLKEIKGIRARFLCCKCNSELGYPSFVAIKNNGREEYLK